MNFVPQVKEILNSTINLTPIQRMYLTTYVELGAFTQVAEHHNVNESTIRRTITRLVEMQQLHKNAVPEHMDMDVPAPLLVKGTSTMYGKDGTRRLHWVKTERDKQDLYDDLCLSMKDLAQELPKIPKVGRASATVDPALLAVYPLGDPHIGLLCYTPEVGQDWDLAIAEKMFLPLFNKLVAAAPPSEECLIIDLGDFWHYDGMEQKTMRSGHKVDADGRPSKMIQVGFRIMRQMIDSALLVHNIVNVKIMPGNHDDLGSIFLRVALHHIYEKNDRVRIDQSPNVFQYFDWGKNLIGIHHGDKCKMAALPMVMAADQPKAWGNAEFRHWYVGHFHNDSTSVLSGKDHQGCKVETFRTIVGTEGYAHEAGYRSQQDGKAIVLHKDYGEIERYTVNIDQVR